MKNSPLELHDDVMFQNENVPGAVKTRYLAMVIDSVLGGVLAGFTAALMKRSGFEDQDLAIAVYAVWMCYPVVLTALLGQTVGKKIMKLKVVTSLGDKAGFGRVLIRETVGRLISIPFGYLWAFFREDRAGWHDLISGTRVVSTDPYAVDSGMGGMKKFALTTGVLSALSAAIIYFVFFTPMPFKQMAKNLELAGFEIEDVGGSIAFGPSVGRISFQDENSSFDLRNVKFTYDLWAVFKNNRVVIKNLSISGGEFVVKASVKNMVGGKKEKKPKPTEQKPQEIARDQKPKAKREPPSLLIERIDIANLKFTAEGKTFNLERFYLDQFLIENKTFKTDRFYLKSDILDLDIAGFVANKEEVKIANYIRGVLRKAAVPKYLAGDLSFEGKLDIDIENKKLRSLAMGLCDRRLQLRKEGEGFVLQTYGLTVSKCLSSSIPFSNASVKIKFSPPQYNAEVVEGQMWVKNLPFRYSKQYGFIHTRGARAYAFKFEPTPMWFMMGPSFPISINQFPSEEEWLSDLYYGKPVSQLAIAEQGDLVKDIKYFKGLPDFGPKPFGNQQRMPSSNVPASAFQRGGSGK